MPEVMVESGPGMDRAAKIRELAYVKWLEAGQPECDGLDFWVQAEQEIACSESPETRPRDAPPADSPMTEFAL